jgi:hypothetical protein
VPSKRHLQGRQGRCRAVCLHTQSPLNPPPCARPRARAPQKAAEAAGEEVPPEPTEDPYPGATFEMIEAAPGERFRRIVLRDTCVQDHMCDGESGRRGSNPGQAFELQGRARSGVEAGGRGLAPAGLTGGRARALPKTAPCTCTHALLAPLTSPPAPTPPPPHPPGYIQGLEYVLKKLDPTVEPPVVTPAVAANAGKLPEGAKDEGGKGKGKDKKAKDSKK